MSENFRNKLPDPGLKALIVPIPLWHDENIKSLLFKYLSGS